MMAIQEFRFDEIGKVVITGSMEGYDFTLPVSYEQALSILTQIKDGGESALNQEANRKRLAKKTKERQEKADKEPGASSRGGGDCANEQSHKKSHTDRTNHSSSTAKNPPQSPTFREPAAPVAHERKRMNKKDLTLFKRFENAMPKVPKGKRRSGETMKKLDIARTYILADQHDKVLDWIKFLKEGDKQLALVANE